MSSVPHSNKIPFHQVPILIVLATGALAAPQASYDQSTTVPPSRRLYDSLEASLEVDNSLEEVSSPLDDDCTSSKEMNYDLSDEDSGNRIGVAVRLRPLVEANRREASGSRERTAPSPALKRYRPSLEISLEEVETVEVVPRPRKEESANRQRGTPKPQVKLHRSSEEVSVEELEAVLEKDNKGKYNFGAQSGMGIGVSQSGWICRRL